jgi:hypothetical protein
MRSKTVLMVCLLASLMVVAHAFAQEGHPLKGTWLGEWGPNAKDRNQVTLVLDWDGKAITGVINPGPDAVKISKASLEPKGWIVRLEADAKDRSGKPLHYVMEGKIENLGLYNRSIVGTWSHDNVKGDFRLQRQ